MKLAVFYVGSILFFTSCAQERVVVKEPYTTCAANPTQSTCTLLKMPINLIPSGNLFYYTNRIVLDAGDYIFSYFPNISYTGQFSVMDNFLIDECHTYSDNNTYCTNIYAKTYQSETKSDKIHLDSKGVLYLKITNYTAWGVIFGDNFYFSFQRIIP